MEILELKSLTTEFTKSAQQLICPDRRNDQ